MTRSPRLWLVLGLCSFILTVAAAPIMDDVSGSDPAEAQLVSHTAKDPSSSAPALSQQLSTYWSPRILQWESLIVEEADHRALDPDFLASLVWMESRGDSQAVGPVGSVGLMQVMPKETGFSWRPSRAELLDPGTNLFWGTRTLATVIQQGNGDVFNALAAYNGGWEQIMYRAPKIFATTILRDYANAVAVRHSLRGLGDWRAVFAPIDSGIRGPIWVADATREDVYLFGNVNWVPEGYPLIPENVPPTAVVAQCRDAEGAPYAVGVWYFLIRQNTWYIDK